jgi:hypothetical protein
VAPVRGARQGVGGLALVVAAVLVALAVARSGDPRGLTLAAGALGCFALAFAVVRRAPASVPTGIFLLGASYGTALLLRGGELDPLAPAFAAALFAVAELAWWSASAGAVPDERSLLLRRLATVAVAALAAGGVGALVLTAADFAFAGGVALEAAGVAAAVLAVGLVAATAARRGR